MKLHKEMYQLETAEDFMDFFGLAYDPARLTVTRLQVLQRFHEYKAAIDACHSNEAEDRLRSFYATALARAYDDALQAPSPSMRITVKSGGCACAGRCKAIQSRTIGTVEMEPGRIHEKI